MALMRGPAAGPRRTLVGAPGFALPAGLLGDELTLCCAPRQAITDSSERYADQNEQDFQEFVTAVRPAKT